MVSKTTPGKGYQHELFCFFFCLSTRKPSQRQSSYNAAKIVIKADKHLLSIEDLVFISRDSESSKQRSAMAIIWRYRSLLADVAATSLSAANYIDKFVCRAWQAAILTGRKSLLPITTKERVVASKSSNWRKLLVFSGPIGLSHDNKSSLRARLAAFRRVSEVRYQVRKPPLISLNQFA